MLGEKDLYRFVVNKTPKAISELVKTTWCIHSALEVIHHEETTKTDTVKALLLPGECVSQCEGEWLRSAKEVGLMYMFLLQLKQSGFNVYVFPAALRDAILKGRPKKKKQHHAS